MPFGYCRKLVGVTDMVVVTLDWGSFDAMGLQRVLYTMGVGVS